eukprot:TRINITY_DN11009_c0_g1_i1.p1 TRINITY_DN11009_c0_g1~~TRINITY_DN11009_c0_g1_i1.p1  ORF type:complete len:153 (-),score=16.44 TRINITY_DN11009_c0_g1_i1:81-539(-)
MQYVLLILLVLISTISSAPWTGVMNFQQESKKKIEVNPDENVRIQMWINSQTCTGKPSIDNSGKNDKCQLVKGGGSAELDCHDDGTFKYREWQTSLSCSSNPDLEITGPKDTCIVSTLFNLNFTALATCGAFQAFFNWTLFFGVSVLLFVFV